MDEGFERGREGRIFFEEVSLMRDAFLRSVGEIRFLGEIGFLDERVVDLTEFGGKQISGRGDATRGVVFQGKREIRIGSREDGQIVAEFLSEGAGEIGIVRGIFDARELDGERVFETRQ